MAQAVTALAFFVAVFLGACMYVWTVGQNAPRWFAAVVSAATAYGTAHWIITLCGAP